MNGPQVSVVIPTKDRRADCRRAVESCLSGQDVPIEVIVVDDGSVDGTEDELAHLPIRFVKQEWRGRAAARNHGVSVARAPLIAFLDSDDLCVAGRFMRQLARLKPEHVACWGQVTFVGETDRAHVDAIRRQIAAIGTAGATPERLAVTMRIYPSTVIVRREAFDETGGFDDSILVAEDVEWHLRLARLGPLAFEPEPVALISLHDANTPGEPMFLEQAEFALRLAAEADGPGDRAFRARLYYLRARSLWSLGENSGARRAGWQALRTDPSVALEPGFLKRQLLGLLPEGFVNAVRRKGNPLRGVDST